MGKEEELITHEAIVEKFAELRAQSQQIAQKANEIAADSSEHESVLKALEGLDPERKCFRQVGGVLVERTVGEVVPAVKNNREQLEMLKGKLGDQLKAKNTELAAFQAKYKIRMRSEVEEEANTASKQSKPEGSKSVLVCEQHACACPVIETLCDD